MPKIPTDINFDIPAEFSITTDDKPFILLDHSYAKHTKRILMFSSEEQFKLMCESSALYMDGTFAVTPRQFKQTYIIQAHHIESEQGKSVLKRKHNLFQDFLFFLFCFVVLPVAWILLNDKKGRTYKILFKQIISLAKSRGYQFSPSNIMSDYESGIISTLRELVSLSRKWLLLLLKSPLFFHRIEIFDV
jgi:hypothetical protein